MQLLYAIKLSLESKSEKTTSDKVHLLQTNGLTGSLKDSQWRIEFGKKENWIQIEGVDYMKQWGTNK